MIVLPATGTAYGDSMGASDWDERWAQSFPIFGEETWTFIGLTFSGLGISSCCPTRPSHASAALSLKTASNIYRKY